MPQESNFRRNPCSATQKRHFACGKAHIPGIIVSRGRVTVARKAHNLEVVGSIPTPATKNNIKVIFVKNI